jgi:hypothetical protein
VTDTGAMWSLVRVVALALVAGVVVLLAGQVHLLTDAVGWLTARLGGGTVPVGDAPGLTRPTVLGGVAVGAVLAGPRRSIGRVTAQVVTLLHELGHVVVAAACGARPSGIVLLHDASGHATSRWRARPGLRSRLQRSVTAFVGTPAPVLLTAAGAQLLLATGPRPVLWTLAVAAVVVAILARSVWTLVVAVGLGGLAAAALRDVAEPWAAAVVVVVLTAIAIRSVRDAVRALGHPLARDHDARAVADQLAVVPPRVVQVGQVVVTAGLGAWTVWLLLVAIR